MKKTVLSLLALGLVVFIIFNLINLFTAEESSVIAELDTMEKSYKLDGIIIRSENQITTATKDGGILDVAVSVAFGNAGFVILCVFFLGSIIIDKIKKRNKNYGMKFFHLFNISC